MGLVIGMVAMFLLLFAAWALGGKQGMRVGAQEEADRRAKLGDNIPEIDRNARGFGWEVGKGRASKDALIIEMSDDNPYKDPDWRRNR